MSEPSEPRFRIRELMLPESIGSVYHTDAFGNRLTCLSRLNVFIGPNNCGKSLLLRSLFSDPNSWSPTDLRFEAFRSAVADFTSYVEETADPDFEIHAFRTALAPLVPPFLDSEGVVERIPESAKISSQLSISKYCRDPLTTHQGFRSASKEYEDRFETMRAAWDPLRSLEKQEPTNFVRVYIPTLRGLRPLADKSPNAYYEATMRDFFTRDRLPAFLKAGRNDVDVTRIPIVTGLELYSELQRHLLGTLKQRETIAEFEEFFGNTFFQRQPITLIPRLNDTVLHVKIGNEKERPVYELGDGIAQLLIITLPLFIHKDANLLLYIEEPELYLHPGYQRLLIDTVFDHLSSSGTRQVFVTTHSHAFVDMTIDRSQCSIYRLTKQLPEEGYERIAKFKVANWSNEDFSLLVELGVRNSSVLLCNCTIWVEGITDRWYIRRMIDLVQEHDLASGITKHRCVEDLHFSFVEYGGANITHWSFLEKEDHPIEVERLCGRLFLIADGDDGDDKDNEKKRRREELSRRLQERFYALQCREVENLLTPPTIESVVRSYEGSDAELKQFAQQDYQTQRIGQFIEASVLATESRRQHKEGGRPYAEKSGTVKAKDEFCKRALEVMNSKDDLSAEAVEIANRLLAFIRAQNGFTH